MTKTGRGSHTNEPKAPRHEAEMRGAPLMRAIALLTRELNNAHTATEALRAALQGLSHLIAFDKLAVTTSVAEDRQQLRATLARGEELESGMDGEVFRVRHTMLARCLETGTPAVFNDAPDELVSGALLISLVCSAPQSVLCAPLMLGGDHNATGTLVISTTSKDAYAETDADIAAIVANLLAATLARIELSERVSGARVREETRERDAALLENLHAAAQSSVDLDTIIQHAIDVLARVLPASFVVMRPVAFGRPEPGLRAWTPDTDRPPLEIHAPVSRAERVVYTEQRPLLIEDIRAERAGSRELQPLAERLGARSLFLTPVIYGGQLLAAIGLVESDAQRRWSHDEQLLLARVAETIAPLILNAQLHSRLRSYIEDLLTLLRLAGEVSSEALMDRSLRAVLDSWSKIAGTDAAAILRWDEAMQEFYLSASKHLPTGILERYRKGITLRDPVCGLAAERRVGVVADLASETRFAEIYAAVRWSGLRAAWATPVVGPANRLLGILITFSRVAVEVSADEQRLADLFAQPVAVAMQNLEQSNVERIHALHTKELEGNLHQSERHKSEFMSIISHELRTPLNAIIGYAQMLKDGFSGDLNEQQRADVQTIIDSADRLLSMVEDTLDLARIDADRFPIYMDSIAFEDILRRAVAGVRSIAEMKGLEIKTKISQDVPVIRTDSERVRQILMSLLSNAVKFTDSGSIEITVERAEKDGVQVSVKDTGIGFDTIAFPHLFEEFRQGDASNTRLHGGTGLGLAISKRLVQRLGGHIGVNSTPGEGSTFWFRLPLEIPGADS